MQRTPVRRDTTRHAGGTPLLRVVPIQGATGIAVDERTARVFVICSTCNYPLPGTVSVLDARSGAFLHTVRVGAAPQAVAVATAAGHVFVANQGGRSVSMLDARSGRVLRTAPIAGDPNTLAMAERAGRVFVTDANASNLSVLDARTGAVLRSFSLPGRPFSLAVAERTNRVFVGAWESPNVSVLDARTGAVLRTVRVGHPSQTMAVDEQSGHVFVYGGEILDARTGAVLRPIAFGGITLAVDAPTRRVFVTEAKGVYVLDVQSGAYLHGVTLAPSPTSIPVVFDRGGRVAILLQSPVDERTGAATGPGYLLVLDGRTAAVRRRISVGAVWTFGLYDVVAADLRTHRLFVLDRDDVRVFDTTRL